MADRSDEHAREQREEATDTTTAPVDCTAEQLLACARESSIADLVPDEATAADGEPIVIGMINQENTPAGSYPELSQAAQANLSMIVYIN